MKTFFVYILQCKDHSCYVGHTDNIELRISQHKNKESHYTSSRLPVEVVFVQTFSSRDEAFTAERKIKGWSRKKKEALICQNFNLLSTLSKKSFDTSNFAKALLDTQDERKR